MKPYEVEIKALENAAKNSSSFRELFDKLEITRNQRANLVIKKRLLEANIDFSHFSTKNIKHNDISSVTSALDHLRDENSRRLRENRKLPSKRGRFICEDAKKSDRKKERVGYDLTSTYVNKAIKNGCDYCGEKNIQITMDRINNDIAHTMKNCRPACIRCNLLRGSMPYKAWIILAPKIREIRESGLFGDWIGSPPGHQRRSS